MSSEVLTVFMRLLVIIFRSGKLDHALNMLLQFLRLDGLNIHFLRIYKRRETHQPLSKRIRESRERGWCVSRLL